MPSNSVEYDQQYWLEHGGKHTLKARLARAEAENERLRAALLKIADDSSHADQYVRWAQEALDRDKCRDV